MSKKLNSGGAMSKKLNSGGATSKKLNSGGATSKKRMRKARKMKTRFTKAMKRKSRHEKQMRAAQKNAACRPRSLRVVDTLPLIPLPDGFVETFPNVDLGGKFALLAEFPEYSNVSTLLADLALGGYVI